MKFHASQRNELADGLPCACQSTLALCLGILSLHLSAEGSEPAVHDASLSLLTLVRQAVVPLHDHDK